MENIRNIVKELSNEEIKETLDAIEKIESVFSGVLFNELTEEMSDAEMTLMELHPIYRDELKSRVNVENIMYAIEIVDSKAVLDYVGDDIFYIYALDIAKGDDRYCFIGNKLECSEWLENNNYELNFARDAYSDMWHGRVKSKMLGY